MPSTWDLAPGEDSLDRWYYAQYVLGTGFTGGPDPVPAHFKLPIYGNQGPGSLTISLWGYSDTGHDLRGLDQWCLPGHLLLERHCLQ